MRFHMKSDLLSLVEAGRFREKQWKPVVLRDTFEKQHKIPEQGKGFELMGKHKESSVMNFNHHTRQPVDTSLELGPIVCISHSPYSLPIGCSM